jgi:hypothetical protein
MYAFFALQHNHNAAAELVVPNRTSFLERHGQSLAFVRRLHGHHSVCVREYRVPPHKGVLSNTRRFLEVPEVTAEYVYMGDVRPARVELAIS